MSPACPLICKTSFDADSKAAETLCTNAALRPDQNLQSVLALIALGQMEAKFSRGR
jgi:hypothetical protein